MWSDTIYGDDILLKDDCEDSVAFDVDGTGGDGAGGDALVSLSNPASVAKRSDISSASSACALA